MITKITVDSGTPTRVPDLKSTIVEVIVRWILLIMSLLDFYRHFRAFFIPLNKFMNIKFSG